MAESNTRNYKITQTIGDATVIRVIRAVSPAQAKNYANRDTTKAEILTADDALVLGARGIVPEDATKEPELEPEPAAA